MFGFCWFFLVFFSPYLWIIVIQFLCVCVVLVFLNPFHLPKENRRGWIMPLCRFYRGWGREGAMGGGSKAVIVR